MNTRDAFDIIKRSVNADPRKTPVESFFDEQAFGNFYITFDEAGGRLSVVHDRGQLILYDGSPSDDIREMLVRDLRDADENAVAEALS
ncbi:MAG: hypothetical protein AB3N06_01430 [Erythrobacter sp.]